MIDWNKLIPTIYQGNVAKGFWEPVNGKVRSLAECKTLMHSEVSEACEWYRECGDRDDPFEPYWKIDGLATNKHHLGAKPVGIPSELADVCIRVCDAMGHWGWHFVPQGIAPYWSMDFLCDLCGIHSFISAIPVLGPCPERGSKSYDCSYVLSAVESLALNYNIDLAAAIDAKMQYNATRAYKHGKRA